MAQHLTNDDIDYDRRANAVYLYFKRPIAAGEVFTTKQVSDDFLIDLDKDDQPLGIHICYAKKFLGVVGKPELEAIVQAVKNNITSAMQSKPQDASLYQRVLALLH